MLTCRQRHLAHGIFFCSSATKTPAETICTTIVIRRLRTVMMTAKAIDGRLLVAAGNEYGFDEIFAREVAAFGAPGDVLICLTTSGKSKNVRRAGRSESAPTGKRSPPWLRRRNQPSDWRTSIFLIRSNSTTRALEAHPASSLCGVRRGM